MALFLYACQSEQKENKPEEITEVETNSKCKFTPKTSKNLSNTFPFNKATKIEAIHFKLDKDFDSYDSFAKIVNHQLVLRNIVYRADLNSSQIQKLFQLLYQHQGNDAEAAKCYEPEHILVFYEGWKAIAFLEICFSCHNVHQENTNFQGFCDEKWEMLYDFFKK